MPNANLLLRVANTALALIGAKLVRNHSNGNDAELSRQLQLEPQNAVKELRKKAIVIDEYFTPPERSERLHLSAINTRITNWYDTDKSHILGMLQEAAALVDFYAKIPLQEADDSTSPRWCNDFMGAMDAISLYSMVKKHNPRLYVECGSGNSTKFVARAIQDHGLRTKIISIDPYPRAEVDTLCHEIIRTPLQHMDLDFFKSLTSEDIFIFDGSHRAFSNSDVTVFMTELLPEFPSGLLYAIHDICLPDDYPDVWVVEEQRYYNEQYLLACYLLGGAMGDTIEMPLKFLSFQPDVQQVFASVWGKDAPLEKATPGACFFWMRKG